MLIDAHAHGSREYCLYFVTFAGRREGGNERRRANATLLNLIFSKQNPNHSSKEFISSAEESLVSSVLPKLFEACFRTFSVQSVRRFWMTCICD